MAAEPLNWKKSAEGMPYLDEDPGEPDGAGGRETHPRMGVAPIESAILSSLAIRRRVVEIGTGLGISTRALASVAEAVYTVDPDPWVYQGRIGAELMRDHPNIVCVPHTKQIPKDYRWDLVFIDGLHTREAVRQDAAFAVSRLEPGGILLFHDTNWPGVHEGLRDFFAQEPLAFMARFPTPGQLGLVFMLGCR